MQKKFIGVVAMFVFALSMIGVNVWAAADNVTITSVGTQVGTLVYGTPDSVTFALEATGDANPGQVIWNATPLPTGVSTNFSPNPVVATGTWSTLLTVSIDEFAEAGVYVINVTATGDGVSAVDSDTITLTIDAMSITPAGVTAEDKVYDNTNVATVTGTLTDVINGDIVTVSGTFSDELVGTDKDVTLVLGGADAGNYILTTPVQADITKKDLTLLTGDFARDTHTYDGTTDANLRNNPSGVTFSGLEAGDDVDVVGGTGTLSSKHVGNNRTVTFNGYVAGGTDGANYNLVNQPADETQDIQTRSITVRPVNDTKVYDGTTDSALIPTVTGGSLAVGDTGAFTQSFGTPTVGTNKSIISVGTVNDGNGGANYTITHNPRNNSEITPLPLTVTGLTANNKIYDKTTTATFALGGSLVGIVGMDDVSPDFSGVTGNFSDADAGNGKSVTVAGIALTGVNASNYSVVQPVVTGNILPRPISITATTASKAYDGTDTASGVSFLSAGTIVIGDSAVYSQAFADKMAGTNKEIVPSVVVTDGNGGLNYAVTPVSDFTGEITPIALTVTAVGNNKVYDATTTASVVYSDDRLMGDDITVLGDAHFTDKHVGNGKTINVTNIVLSGTDAGNYVANATTSATGDITEATLTITITADNRVYDGTREATITTSDDRIAGDDITVEYPVAGANRPLFGGRHVGNNKTVNVAGLTITGPDALNYVLFNTSASDTGVEITPAPLNVAFVADSKVYDDSVVATISSSSMDALLHASDVVTLVIGDAEFSDEHVGVAKTVTGSNFALGGAQAGNYFIDVVATTSADITPLTLTVTALGNNKVYDATTTASVVYSDDRLMGDDITVLGDAHFTDKHVGNGKTINVTNIVLSGTDAGNYVANATTSTTGDITAKSLVVTVTGVDKVYDANTTATVVFADDREAGDSFTITADANFDDKEVGTGKLVTVTNIALSGADALNYTANTGATTTASITAKPKSGGGGGTIKKTTPAGSVLGAATTTVATTTATTSASYQFLFNLSIGMTNSDVVELQKVLIAQGFLKIEAPTGYFGPLTFEAVKLYQAKNSITNTGFVGPLTRGALNAGL